VPSRRPFQEYRDRLGSSAPRGTVDANLDGIIRRQAGDSKNRSRMAERWEPEVDVAPGPLDDRPVDDERGNVNCVGQKRENGRAGHLDVKPVNRCRAGSERRIDRNLGRRRRGNGTAGRCEQNAKPQKHTDKLDAKAHDQPMRPLSHPVYFGRLPAAVRTPTLNDERKRSLNIHGRHLPVSGATFFTVTIS
jgi:hypothetical protein